MKQRENRNKKKFRNSIIYNSINKSRSIILYLFQINSQKSYEYITNYVTNIQINF